MSCYLQLASAIKNGGKLKIFSMLEVTGVNFNIQSNAIIAMKIEDDMMLYKLRISQKLILIFTLNSPTNSG